MNFLIKNLIISVFLFGGEMKSFNLTTDEQTFVDLEVDTIYFLEKKHKMKFAGARLACKDPKDFFCLNFKIMKKLSQAEITEIILDSALYYRERINSNEKMQKQIAEHPFRLRNVEIDISMYAKNGNGIVHPDIGRGRWEDGKLYYTTRSPENFYKDQAEYIVSLEEVMPTLSEDLQKRLKEATIH